MAEIIGGPCKTCGFLAVMQSYAFDGRSIVMEASQQTRDGIHPPGSWVRCFLAKQDIPAKVAALGEAGVPVEDRLRLVLREEHECWYEWKPYFDPQWHYEDRSRMQLEEMRQKQTEIMTKVMEDHKNITEKLATINSGQAAADKRQEDSNRRFNILFIGIGLIAVILALAQLAYPDGIAWVVDNAPGAINPQAEAPLLAPSPAAVMLTPTPSPESTPGTASPQPQAAP